MRLERQTILLRSRRFDSVFQGVGRGRLRCHRTLTIVAPVVIDGTSQPGYDGAFNRIYVEGVAGISSVFLPDRLIMALR